jgi:hypothetical protein
LLNLGQWHTPAFVKLVLPPRQSRGISQRIGTAHESAVALMSVFLCLGAFASSWWFLFGFAGWIALVKRLLVLQNWSPQPALLPDTRQQEPRPDEPS